MENDEIIESNKLIAEFMGATFKDNHAYIPNHAAQCYEKDCLAYYSSWDWLMPVVDKIEEISFDNIKSEYVPYTKHPFTIDMSYNYAKVKVDNDFKIENLREDGINFKIHRGSKINACYQAVVEFIKWYNENRL